ncbi:MAG: ATP-binding domain-containing protein [Verrucomicrobiota bacterium]
MRNGEVGIVHAAADNTRLVHFENRDKGIPLSNLPAHSPAWGITIHRSQGSEYDNVVVLLPRDAGSPLATRELLYTAITRCKKNLLLFGPREVITRAIENPAERTTLLHWHLATSRPAVP